MVAELSVRELKQRREAGESLLVLDVRDPWELAIAQLPDVLNIPMNEIAGRLAELDPNRETIVMCRSGGRSAHVAHFLAEQGFARVANLSGGILAWAEEIDPSLATY